jgi:hypothetical protein
MSSVTRERVGWEEAVWEGINVGRFVDFVLFVHFVLRKVIYGGGTANVPGLSMVRRLASRVSGTMV